MAPKFKHFKKSRSFFSEVNILLRSSKRTSLQLIYVDIGFEVMDAYSIGEIHSFVLKKFHIKCLWPTSIKFDFHQQGPNPGSHLFKISRQAFSRIRTQAVGALPERKIWHLIRNIRSRKLHGNPDSNFDYFEQFKLRFMQTSLILQGRHIRGTFSPPAQNSRVRIPAPDVC